MFKIDLVETENSRRIADAYTGNRFDEKTHWYLGAFAEEGTQGAVDRGFLVPNRDETAGIMRFRSGLPQGAAAYSAYGGIELAYVDAEPTSWSFPRSNLLIWNDSWAGEPTQLMLMAPEMWDSLQFERMSATISHFGRRSTAFMQGVVVSPSVVREAEHAFGSHRSNTVFQMARWCPDVPIAYESIAAGAGRAIVPCGILGPLNRRYPYKAEVEMIRLVRHTKAYQMEVLRALGLGAIDAAPRAGLPAGSGVTRDWTEATVAYSTLRRAGRDERAREWTVGGVEEVEGFNAVWSDAWSSGILGSHATGSSLSRAGQDYFRNVVIPALGHEGALRAVVDDIIDMRLGARSAADIRRLTARSKSS